MSTPGTQLAFDGPLRSARLVLTDPRYFWLVAGLVIAGDAALTALIVRFVPCKSPPRPVRAAR